jgi:hypothetical protein
MKRSVYLPEDLRQNALGFYLFIAFSAVLDGLGALALYFRSENRGLKFLFLRQ